MIWQEGIRMKRRLLAGMCIGAMLLGLSGCNIQTEENEPQIVRGEAPEFEDGLIQIGLIQTGKESDWRDANTEDYLNTFVEERGYNLIYVDGNSSPDRQIKAMYDLIQQKVDYIILQPIVETGWDDAIEKANQSGIPVIVADRQIKVDESKYVTWIGSDFHEEGKKAIKWLENYLDENDRGNDPLNIVVLEGTEGATAAIGRAEGIAEGIATHDNWKVVASECANFTQGEGQSVMEEILGKTDADKIDVIISENDNMIFGAMKALEQAGASYGPNGRIIMISFDALGEAFQKMMAGKLHASIECNPLLAGNVEQVIMDLEAGIAVDKKYYTRESVYDYTNAAQYIDERVY